ncbi:hypothetical protein Ahia01_001334600 [Argonauta hians]
MAEGGFDITTTVPDLADNGIQREIYDRTELIETVEIDRQEGTKMLELDDIEPETTASEPQPVTTEDESTDTAYEDDQISSLPMRRMSSLSCVSRTSDNVLLLTNITKIDNVFAKYSTFTIISGVGALATALFGICHLIYITSTNQLDNVGYGHIFLDLSMVGGSVLLIYIMYAYLTEKWTYNVCGLLAGLLFSLPTVACPSIMLFLKYEPVVITAIVSSCLVLLIWPLMGIFHYKAYCRVRPVKLL